MTGRLLDALLDELATDPAALERLRELVGVHLGERQASRAPAYTVATLASELGRSERSIRAAIARGELHAVKRGRGWVISGAAVAQWASASVPGLAVPPPRRRRPGPGPARRALQS